jgi:hypothetical protein
MATQPVLIMASDRLGRPIPCLSLVGGIGQTLAYDGNARSTALNAGTRVVRLVSTTRCYVVIAAGTPTADNTGALLSPDTEYFFRVAGGEVVAAIKYTDGGNLNVFQMQ